MEVAFSLRIGRLDHGVCFRFYPLRNILLLVVFSIMLALVFSVTDMMSDFSLFSPLNDCRSWILNSRGNEVLVAQIFYLPAKPRHFVGECPGWSNGSPAYDRVRRKLVRLAVDIPWSSTTMSGAVLG